MHLKEERKSKRNQEEEQEIKQKRSKRKAKGRANREFAIVTYSFLAIFLALIGYITYFQVFRAEDVINNPYNKRQALFADSMIRGDIISREGKTLATTKVSSDGEETRVYPYKKVFAHAVGYSTNGTTGVESIANFSLLRTHTFIGNQLINMISGEKNRGDTVVTTLSAKLQQVAYDALGSYDGAVVALDPSTGEILTMVSKPDYDPNRIATDYDSIIGDSDSEESNSVLLNRATQGSYTPGSTFKIFTTLEYLREKGNESDYSYQCSGSVTEDGTTIHCYDGEVHGKISLEEAFAESCNCAYATMGLGLNMNNFAALSKKLLFDSELPVEYPYTKSKFSLTNKSSKSSIMMGSFGQDKITVSPIHLALVSSAIANDGILMDPYVVDHVENDAQTVVTQTEPEEYKRLLTRDMAKQMQSYMEATVSYGTAKSLQSDKYTAAGKTGSAQVSDSSDDTHSWFVGYAKNESGKAIAIAVIVEKQGNGSRYAVPIAKKVFDSYFKD